MLKNLTQLYCLIVCLVSSLIMMITISLMLVSVTDFAFVDYKYKKNLSKFLSNEKYIEYKAQDNDKDATNITSLSDDAIEAKRIAAKQDYIEEVKDYAVGSIINSSVWFFTALLFFIIHWRMRKCYSTDPNAECK